MMLHADRTSSPEETRALGEAFGALLAPGDFVSLEGDLGAGKTLFAKGVARALGCDPDEVQSPTFTLVREYEGRVRVYHLDLYRLDDPEEDLVSIGYEEFFDPDAAVALVEWAERADGLRPARRFDVRIEKDGEGRRITIVALGGDAVRMARLREALSRAVKTP